MFRAPGSGTGSQRPRADRAVHRRRYPRIGDVQRRLMFDRMGAVELRHRLGAFGGENVDLPLRRHETGLAVL